MKPNELKLYNIIKKYQEENGDAPIPSYSTLGKQMGVSRQYIFELITGLRKLGYITSEKPGMRVFIKKRKKNKST